MPSDYETRVTLLHRLKEADGENDWEEFYTQYARFIISVAMRCGLPLKDAEDVLQDTMSKLMRLMGRSDYTPDKGTFRGYLRTMVRNESARYHSRNPHHLSLDQLVIEGEAMLVELIEDAQVTKLFEGVDADWKGAILEEAVHQLMNTPGVREENVMVMQALLKGCRVEEIAAQSGKNANAIYQVKHRVQRKLREMVAELMETGP